MRWGLCYDPRVCVSPHRVLPLIVAVPLVGPAGCANPAPEGTQNQAPPAGSSSSTATTHEPKRQMRAKDAFEDMRKAACAKDLDTFFGYMNEDEMKKPGREAMLEREKPDRWPPFLDRDFYRR